jgi:hypothetical protein
MEEHANWVCAAVDPGKCTLLPYQKNNRGWYASRGARGRPLQAHGVGVAVKYRVLAPDHSVGTDQAVCAFTARYHDSWPAAGVLAIYFAQRLEHTHMRERAAPIAIIGAPYWPSSGRPTGLCLPPILRRRTPTSIPLASRWRAEIMPLAETDVQSTEN